MKTYDEMARYVLEVRDEHERKRKKRITFIKRSVPAAIAVMGAFIIGFGIWKGYKRPEQLPSPDNIINNTSVTTTLPHASETALITTTNKTVITSETSETSVSASTQTTKISQTTAEASVTTAVSAEESSEASAVTALSTTKAAATSSAAAKTTSSTSQPVPHAIITTTIAYSGLSGDPSTGTGTGAGGALPSSGAEGSGGSQTVGGGGAAPPSTEGNGGGGIYDPWYGLPIYQQFTNAYVSGYTKTYTSGCVISDRYVGDMIGSVNMESGQPVEGFIKQCTAEAFHINGIDAESAIAVKFYGHNEYYLYHTRDTDIYDIMKQIT